MKSTFDYENHHINNPALNDVLANSKDIFSKYNLLENKYESLYKKANVALFKTRLSDGKILECNEKLSHILGYQNAVEALSKYIFSEFYFDPTGRQEFIEHLKEKEEVENCIIKGKKPDGQLLWLKVSAKLNKEEDCIEGAVWDVTAQKILTSSEKQVLDLVLQGDSNKEIAKKLCRSIRTVEDHRAHIMHKLGASNVVELMKKAINMGFDTDLY